MRRMEDMSTPLPSIEEYFSNILHDSVKYTAMNYVPYSDNTQISGIIARFTPIIPAAIRLFLDQQTAIERLSFNSMYGTKYSFLLHRVADLMLFELHQCGDVVLYPFESSQLSYIRRNYSNVRRELFGKVFGRVFFDPEE